MLGVFAEFSWKASPRQRLPASTRGGTPEPRSSIIDAARMRLPEIVILRLKTWLSEETRNGFREAEAFRREQVRVHFRLLERFRTQHRAEGTFSL
jgi:hypothetical protein